MKQGITIGSRVSVKSSILLSVNGLNGEVVSVLSTGPYPFEVKLFFPESSKPVVMPFSESELVLQ